MASPTPEPEAPPRAGRLPRYTRRNGYAELREKLDPWGPTDPAALALMRGLKDEFDPHRVLNPGRFVGGL